MPPSFLALDHRVVTHDWLEIRRGDAPLVVSFPHTGIAQPGRLEKRLVSPRLARKDADWWIERLYDFPGDLGATTIRIAASRTAIDVDRDPSGASLYPGQATTEVCPTTTFDGDPLYRPGEDLRADKLADRRTRWFDPYHLPHILRHTCTTWLVRSRAPLWEVAGFVGKTMEMIQRVYGHHAPRQLANAANAVR